MMIVIIACAVGYLTVGFIISLFTVDTNKYMSELDLMMWVFLWPFVSLFKIIFILHRKLTRK